MRKISVYHSFEELPKSFEEMFGGASSRYGVFLSLPWFRNLAATAFENNRQLRIYVLESGDGDNKPYAALPMCCDASSKCVLAPHKLTAAANCYTSLFSPVSGETGHCTQKNLNLLVEAIAADALRWDTIDLHPMEASTPLFQGALDAFRHAGMAVQTYFCFGNWYLDVNGRSYQEYFSTLPSQLKNTLKRKTKQLGNSDRLHIDIISSPGDVVKGICAYEKVYNASWKIPEAFPAFIPGLIRTCAEHEWLRLGVAYIDDQPAAAQIWIVSNGVASIYKMAYDEQFHKLSVGTILTARLMQHVIDVDKVREVDYLTGDDPYKQDWMSHRRERRGILAFNLNTVHGTLLAIRHIGGRALKNTLRFICLRDQAESLL